MNYLKRLFGIQESYDQPDIEFGRYSDSYKEEENYEYWDKALEQFEQKQYLDAFENFLKYLTNDQDNLTYTRTADEINFELFQGSKMVTGVANRKKIMAMAKVALTTDKNIGFLRKLVEQNFTLKYSKYSLDEEDAICLTFTSYMLDGSPYKLYYALKELSVNADKQDDILLEEFESLTAVNTGHLRNVSEEQKRIKYEYLHQELDVLIHSITDGKLDTHKYPGGISYLILSTIYKLDYLIHPEGSTMEALEKIHKAYFLKDGKTAERRNHDMLKKLRQIKDRSQEHFYSELYGVKSTFGITAPTAHDRVKELIDDELQNMDWYVQNNYENVGLAIPSYIAGYCLFNYAIPLPVKQLFTLYYQIFEHTYFESLGFKQTFWTDTALHKGNIKSAILEIEQEMREDFPEFRPNTRMLVFTSPAHFAKSYMLMIKELDVKKLKRLNEKE